MNATALRLSEVFLEIRSAGERGIEVTLQYLDTKEEKFAVLSDGHYYAEFAVIKTMRPPLAQLTPNDVITATVRIFKDTFILLRLEKIRSQAAKIGQPLFINAKSPVDYQSKPVLFVSAATNPRPVTRPQAEDRTDGVIDDLWKDRKKLQNLSVADTNFTIFFRIEKKTLRNFRNALGNDKQLLSCIGFDETEKMSLTFFEPVCRFANEILEEGALYCLSNGDVSKGSKWSPSRRGLTITYSRNAKDLYKVEDKVYLSMIPEVFPNDIACVSFLQNLVDDDVVSVLGIVANKNLSLADESSSFCTVTLIDDRSLVEIRVWGSFVMQPEELEIGKIVICQNLRVFVDPKAPRFKQFKFTGMSRFVTSNIPSNLEGLGKLQLIASGRLPDLSTLAKQSYYATKKYTPCTIERLLSETQQGISVRDFDSGSDSASKFFEVTAYLNDITRDKCFYRVCPRDACKKGVTVNADGKIECEKCGTFNLGLKANSRYLGEATFSDCTGEFSASFCDNKGDTILGLDANSAFELFEKDEFTAAKLKRFGLRFIIGVRAVIHADACKPPEYKIVYISEPTGEKILSEIKHLNSEIRRLALSKRLVQQKFQRSPELSGSNVAVATPPHTPN